MKSLALILQEKTFLSVCICWCLIVPPQSFLPFCHVWSIPQPQPSLASDLVWSRSLSDHDLPKASVPPQSQLSRLELLSLFIHLFFFCSSNFYLIAIRYTGMVLIPRDIIVDNSSCCPDGDNIWSNRGTLYVLQSIRKEKGGLFHRG